MRKIKINKPEKGLIPIPYEKVKEWMWVIVIYEEEKWIGKVVTKGHDQVCVRCLEKPFVIHQPVVGERRRFHLFQPGLSQWYHTRYPTNGRKVVLSLLIGYCLL